MVHDYWKFDNFIHNADYIIVIAAGTGFGAQCKRCRFTSISNLMFILAIMRFAASKVSLASDSFELQDSPNH